MSQRQPRSRQEAWYSAAASQFGAALGRLTAGYESDPEKRQDLRQEIHLQLWKSFQVFDERCSLRTWTFRVAHNTAASYVMRERRKSATFVSLEEFAETAECQDPSPDIDYRRALERLFQLIVRLRTPDRQIMLCYLEEMDSAAIAEITGLSPANVLMKIHRIKKVLGRHFREEQQHV